MVILTDQKQVTVLKTRTKEKLSPAISNVLREEFEKASTSPTALYVIETAELLGYTSLAAQMKKEFRDQTGKEVGSC
jgi:hypothetical protein